MLLYKGRAISKSLVILKHHRHETWNRCPLLPQDPYARTMARFCRSWKNSLKGRNSVVDTTSDIWTLRLDGWPLHFGVFEEISSLKVVDGERFPPLFAWLKEFSDAPIIKDRWPPHDKLNLKFIALRQVHRTKSSSAWTIFFCCRLLRLKLLATFMCIFQLGYWSFE